MRRSFLLLGLAFLVVAVPAAAAGTPSTMSFQGVLTDPAGAPVVPGDYDITFSLYNVAAGGAALWTETQTLPVTHGIFEAILGSVEDLDLDFDEQYWIGVQVGADPELTPRTALAASPYARHAAIADSALAGGSGMGGLGGVSYIPKFTGTTVLGNSVLYEKDGFVGIGLLTPTSKLNIYDPEPEIRLQTPLSGNTWNDGLQIGPNATGALDCSVFNRENGFLMFGTNNLERMRITAGGSVGIGTLAPVQALDVNGTVQMTGFKMPTGAINNYVLTSDGSGLGRWAAGASGDITGVFADGGLLGGGVLGDTHLDVGAGDGIDVLADAVAVDVTDIAGNGLGEDTSNNIVVNTGTGLEISTDNLQLTAAYRDGSAHDGRFVNEAQASSVTNAMVQNDAIDGNKLADNIDASTLGFNADKVDGVHAASFMQLRVAGTLAAGSTISISIPSWTPWTLELAGGWPQVGGVCHVTGFENDRNIGITYVKYNGDGTSGYGGAEGLESSTTTLVSWGSGGHTYSVQCPGEATGDHNIVLAAAATGVELRYRLIW